jgi:hypothetical protein
MTRRKRPRDPDEEPVGIEVHPERGASGRWVVRAGGRRIAHFISWS